jgi:hypothetical protein
MTDKMREEFEVAIAKNQLAGGFPPANFERCGLDGRYVLPEIEGAWWGWQASRESLVIELPTVGSEPEAPEDAIDDSYMDAHHATVRMRNRCYLAIEAAGLKVTP